MALWSATGYGALDLRENELSERGFELVVAPIGPGEPVFLFGPGAELWRRLVEKPLEDSLADEATLEMLGAFRSMAIARPMPSGRSVLRRVDPPWLRSPLHELVYAIIASVAAELRIDVVFIKGPVLHAQGLRERDHSGDVDCWVRPGDDLRLAQALAEWGWTPLYSPFTGTALPHALTLRAGGWGCAIDVHCRFPGMAISPEKAFDVVYSESEVRRFAGVSVRTPSRLAHSVIAALHAVRPFRGSPPSSYELEDARAVLTAVGEEVLETVGRLGAGFVLHDLLSSAFPHRELPSADAMPPTDWEWRLTPYGPKRHWKAFALIPMRHRARVLRRLIWQPSAEMRVAYDLPEASQWTLIKMRLSRLGQGMRAIVRAR